MNMTAAEESLLKLTLTAEMNSIEKMIAGRLAARYPEGEFYEYDPNVRRGNQKYKTGRSDPIEKHFKYKFERNGETFKADVRISGSPSGHRNSSTLLGIGFDGVARGNKPLHQVRMNKGYWCADSFRVDDGCSESLYNLKLGDALETVFNKLVASEDDIPRYLDHRDSENERLKKLAEADRDARQDRKDRKREAVFRKHKVRSTPETELLFKVLSRLNDEKAISKAFGELLPLIRGNDGN
jgi:hypothetical protein